jgi:hypothetical protein
MRRRLKMKLHELLAVEGSIRGQSQKVRSDLASTFEKKRHLFEGLKKTFFPSDEAAASVVEDERTIQSTVPKELKWISGFLAKSIDSGYAINVANTQAQADVFIGDNGDGAFLFNVPATALLELEKRLAEVQEFLLTIPTLDPAKGFETSREASSEGDIYKAREVRKTRTKKIQKPLVLAPATEQHPAQVQLVSEDVPTGTILEQEWSGLITPAAKADMIARCEELSRAVKKARSRANDQEFDRPAPIGKKILDYVFGF